MRSSVTQPSAAMSHIDASIGTATDHLLSLQYESGYWWAELESNVTITAEHIFLRHILGIPDEAEARKAGRYLLSQQRDDGTWGNWYDGPPELSTSIEAYAALKMIGISPDAPEMMKARDYILSQGGVERVRVFTKIWFAMLGEWDWRGLPILPVEFTALPSWFPMSIYSFGCWARQTIVPLAIVMAYKPVVPLRREQQIDELFARGRENADLAVPVTRRSARARCFLIADRLLHVYDRMRWKPFRAGAIRRAKQWILDRQEADGSWGGIQPPWVYSLIALYLLGDNIDSGGALANGFAGFYGPQGFAVEDDETFHLQSCLSPVWDTGLALMALEDAGLPSDHPAVTRAAEWLLAEQIFTGGDWQARCAAPPGGWAFEFANDKYPDTDDTAVVIMALLNAKANPKRAKHAIARAEDWLIAMQSRNGGWGAFDRNNTQTWTRDIPFADFGEMIDPPSADVTGHIIECLGRRGYRIGQRTIDRAVTYLKREQDSDGAWFGRWGTNLTYGIGSVLPGLAAVGERMDSPYVRRAVNWLVEHQNDDGGWGERIEGYYDAESRGRGPSTASQTAWALLGLLAAEQLGHPSTCRGIDYLIATQRKTGGWDEPQFTGTGFPTDFMIRYHIYRDVFPLMALGRYRRGLEKLE